ncbi:MAG: hypothetical protein ACREUB_10380, partial [Burkholderiales bacterium]
MTDTRNRAGRAADEATLDLFEPGAVPAASKKADTQVATKAKRSQAKGRRAGQDKAGPVAGAGRGGGGARGGG